MATRKSEWLASIKPILDRDEAKKDAAALAKELGDILEVKVDASPENLDELAKEFNAQLKTMGKQPIVFSEKTLKGVVAQFASAISAGINDSIDVSMKRLRAERDQIIGEQKSLEARKQKLKGVRDFSYDLADAEENGASAFNLKEVDKMKRAATAIGQSFDDFVLEMKSNVEGLQYKLSKLKVGTPEFDTAIKDFYEQTHDLFRMSATLSKYPDLVQDKTILEDFDFGNLQDLFADDITDYFSEFGRALNGVYTTLDGFKSRLTDIDDELRTIQSHSGNIIDEDCARNGLKTLQEIEETSDRLSEKYARQNKQKISSFVDYNPKQKDGIATFRDTYIEAAASGDWVEEYGALVKYVRLYESYLKMGTKAQQNKITAKNNPYTKLYKQLKPMAENAENMLRSVLNMMDGKPVVGIGGSQKDGVTGAGYGPTEGDVVNAQKLREEIELKAKADQEAAEAEAKLRKEAEAKAKAEAKALELAKQKRAEEAALAAEKEKNALAQKVSDDRVPGSILDNPMFANMFKRATVEADDKRVANEASADAAKEELDTTKQTTEELEKQQKLLLYRRVEGEFDLNRIGSRSIDALYNKKKEPIIQEALEWGFGGFGDGLYGATLGGAENLALDTSGKTSFIEFDASDYNFYINQTVEQAEALRGFLLSLQKLVGANTILDASKLTDIEDLSEDQLFEKALQIFKNFGMSKEQFTAWIENAKKESEIIASLFAKGEVPEDRHNFGTRFMKTIGYQGVLNQTGDEEYDGNYQGSVIYDPDVDKIKESLTVFKSVDEYLAHIEATAQSADRAVDGLNESLGQTKQEMSGGTSGVGDASSADLEAAMAQVESLQAENDALQNQLQASEAESHTKDNAIQALRQQLAESKANEGGASSEELEAERRQSEQLREENSRLQELNAELESDNRYYADAIYEEAGRANKAEARVAELEQQVAGSFEGGKKTDSVNTEELKTLLSAITYNVKIAHDDNDKQANKIALDDSTLESTLTKVFANILKPEMSQDTTERPQEHWALESTLQAVKGVLDNIHTNTTKIGTAKPSNVDTIAGTSLDGRLAEIKSVLEYIDGKIAKGGVIATRGAVKQANTQPIESEAKAQTARSNMMKSLINDYKTMGKLAAKFASDNNLETKAILDNLKEEIARKRQSLKVTMDENKSLREKYSIAFDAEKRLLDAAKAQEEIDKQNRENDRDEKAAWKKQVKDAQRETGINAADSIYRATNNTVIRAIGTEGISADIEAKAKELAEQNKVLNNLRNSINEKGAEASEKDRDNLSKQIAKVKELKTEVDGYLKIHEKYSGDNVTDLGDGSNFGAAGTNEYWNNITAAIQNASSGKVVIKGLNADTGELTGTTKIAANTFAQWTATVDPLTGRLSMLRTGIKKTETVIEQIKRKTKEIFTYFSGSSMIFKAVNELKKGVQYVRDIDLALTELKKVTDETEETYRKFLDTASKTAAKVGSTIKDVVSSTADWARLGYSMEEAAKFAETTQILMNVSEFTDVSQATDTLISSVQAFGYTAETSMEVVDLLNTIGNNYAISTADLAQSLTKSSASLVAAGGDLAEAAALTATANKIIQD